MTTARSSSIRAWAALVGLALPLFALSVDVYGVGVLLPEIATDLHVTAIQSGAVVSVTAIGFAAPLLFVGRLTDHFGPRPMLLGGVLGFAIASVVCAAADSFGLLLAGRGLQGVASVCCFTTSLAVIDASFGDDRRPVAVGIWAAIGGIGGAVGPLVGSAVTSLWSWRVFFILNAGIGLLSVAVLAIVVPRTAGDPTRRLQPERLLVLALGIGFAVGALQRAGGSGWDARSMVLIVVGGILITLAVVRRGRGPLITPSVTRPWSFRVGTAVATTSNWGSGVVCAFVPSALVAGRGFSVLETGAVFLAFTAAFVGGFVSGPLVERIGGFTVAGASSGVQAVGLAGLGLIGLDAPLGAVLVALAVAGLGNGVAYSAATSLGLVEVPTDDAGEASGVLTMWRLLGLTIGVAVSSMIVDGIADHHFRRAGGLDAALLVAAAVTAVGVLAVRGATSGRR